MFDMDKKKRAEARRKAQGIQASVHVGKEGITEGARAEIMKQLKKHEHVKVRLLPSVEEDRREVAGQLALATNSDLVEVRGRTVVLARK